MRKHDTQKSADITLTAEDVEAYGAYLDSANDADRTRVKDRIGRLERGVEEYEREVKKYQDYANEERASLAEEQEKLAGMPELEKVDRELARVQLESASKLPFVKSLTIADGKATIITKENSLYTELTKKFSANDRWYSVKPYRIPLPSYKIVFTLAGFHTVANSENVLTLALANTLADTGSFKSTRYVHQPHAHWSTPRAYRGEPSDYCEPKSICFGEYEPDMNTAFRKGLADGLLALAIFLQQAGARYGHVNSRHEWAYWLGKADYYPLIVPSLTKKDIVEPEDEDTDIDHVEEDHDICGECGGCRDCEECGCEYDEDGNVIG